jgi:RNA polymerase sigma-70 factor (ECF subfamily)
MPSPAEEFAELVAKARQGDADALGELARRYEPDVRVVARLRLGAALRPYLDSIDLVQSVHKSLLRGLQQNRFDLSTPEQLVALALTMVRRKAARHWRRQQRQRRLEAGPDAAELPALLTSLSAPRSDPAEAAQFNDEIARLCRHLDPNERRVIELRLEGFTRDEAAAELGMDRNALIACLTRVRRRLRAGGVLTEWL